MAAVVHRHLEEEVVVVVVVEAAEAVAVAAVAAAGLVIAVDHSVELQMLQQMAAQDSGLKLPSLGQVLEHWFSLYFS